MLERVCSAVVHRLLTLSGYDRHVVARLQPADVGALTLSSALCLVSAGMYAAAASYLAYIAVYAGSARWPISVWIGAGVFIFAVTMQRLYVTTGGYAHHWDQTRLAAWRPDRLRLVCVLIIASLMSLPFVLMRNHDRLDQHIEQGRAAKVAFYRDQLKKARQASQQEIARARALAIDRERQVTAMLEGHASFAMAHVSTAPSQRKVLLIGAQHYQDARTHNSTVTDVELLQRAFDSAGFTTTLSLDDSGDKLRLRIDAYLKSLAPGDLSVVYYSGRIASHAGRNFLVPVDYHAERNPNGYPAAQLIDELAKSAPQLSAVIIDAATWRDSDVTPTLAPLRTAARTAILVSTATRRPVNSRDGGPLAVALAQQIAPNVDLRQLLARAAAQVSNLATSSNRGAQQVTLLYGPGSGPEQSIASAGPATQNGAGGPALAQTTVCPSATGLPLQRCLRAYIRMFDDRLAALKLGQVDDAVALGQYRESLARSSMLRERWKLLWQDPTVFVQVVLVVLFMVLGDMLRDLRAEPLRHYEQLRANHARDAVEAAYSRVRKTVGAMLATCPADPFPGLRWHERSHYFGAPSGAWLSLGGLKAPLAGSDAEFRQALGLPQKALASPATVTPSNTSLPSELPA